MVETNRATSAACTIGIFFTIAAAMKRDKREQARKAARRSLITTALPRTTLFNSRPGGNAATSRPNPGGSLRVVVSYRGSWPLLMFQDANCSINLIIWKLNIFVWIVIVLCWLRLCPKGPASFCTGAVALAHWRQRSWMNEWIQRLQWRPLNDMLTFRISN